MHFVPNPVISLELFKKVPQASQCSAQKQVLLCNNTAKNVDSNETKVDNLKDMEYCGIIESLRLISSNTVMARF